MSLLMIFEMRFVCSYKITLITGVFYQVTDFVHISDMDHKVALLFRTVFTVFALVGPLALSCSISIVLHAAMYAQMPVSLRSVLAQFALKRF